MCIWIWLDRDSKISLEKSTPSSSQFVDRIAPNRSHVKGGIQFLGQLQNLDLKSVLNVHKHSLISSSFFVLLLISSDEVDCQSLGSKTTSSTYSVQVSVSISREIYVTSLIP